MARKKQKNSDNPVLWLLGILVALGILLFILRNILIIAPIVIALVVAYFWNKRRIHKNRIQEEENRRQQEIQTQKEYERKKLQSGIREIDVMKGEDFEEFLAVLFRNFGLQVETTPKSKDFGADLILTNKEGKRVAVQAKRYERTVGVDAVQQVIGALGHYNAQEAWVITNNYFSDGAKELAKSNNVRLNDRDALIELIVGVKQKVAKKNNTENIQTVTGA